MTRRRYVVLCMLSRTSDAALTELHCAMLHCPVYAEHISQLGRPLPCRPLLALLHGCLA